MYWMGGGERKWERERERGVERENDRVRATDRVGGGGRMERGRDIYM